MKEVYFDSLFSFKQVWLNKMNSNYFEVCFLLSFLLKDMTLKRK